MAQPIRASSPNILLMLFIYYSICRAYCLFLDHLLSGAIRYLWSTKDIIYAGPKMLKKWFYWVVIGRRIFLFHDLLLFAIFTHQNIVFQDGRSHHKDSVKSHIHKVTVLQKILEVVLLLMIPFMLIVSPFLWQMFGEKNEL